MLWVLLGILKERSALWSPLFQVKRTCSVCPSRQQVHADRLPGPATGGKSSIQKLFQTVERAKDAMSKSQTRDGPREDGRQEGGESSPRAAWVQIHADGSKSRRA